ncbi:MAG: (2Fe-2S) ferredoxin domain-containing protein [Bacteroidota bacterium]|jgi:NADH:ubiquinone oxidoreductase subunit E|nr:(2Fe-2S) ferredoxin domain-containing protein [Ignavibacteria bacterium]HEX2963906.1 (2Fe-2S) ferredoxin domain-containing protein [Ignavibacteriales bacterium]MCU7498224.1 (2Fe-2S) ferredoxin domain-containing protein [Ignavibacteria bacterium]MCU7511284.1 (2Fe-2S) ferredoxin domain-containing protein [Ignavibacteria bacterium]MCU7518994.1 (2Fe-2S) ferredoxin domain-containing protein [Ignavibacteria bacterium]
MQEENIQNSIVICMGSSCFSRGNNKNLEVIREFIRANNLKLKVEVSGNLCEDMCNKGPNVRINGKLYNFVDPSTLVELLNYVLIK